MKLGWFGPLLFINLIILFVLGDQRTIDVLLVNFIIINIMTWEYFNKGYDFSKNHNKHYIYLFIHYLMSLIFVLIHSHIHLIHWQMLLIRIAYIIVFFFAIQLFIKHTSDIDEAP